MFSSLPSPCTCPGGGKIKQNLRRRSGARVEVYMWRTCLATTRVEAVRPPLGPSRESTSFWWVPNRKQESLAVATRTSTHPPPRPHKDWRRIRWRFPPPSGAGGVGYGQGSSRRSDFEEKTTRPSPLGTLNLRRALRSQNKQWLWEFEPLAPSFRVGGPYETRQRANRRGAGPKIYIERERE